MYVWILGIWLFECFIGVICDCYWSRCRIKFSYRLRFIIFWASCPIFYRLLILICIVKVTWNRCGFSLDLRVLQIFKYLLLSLLIVLIWGYLSFSNMLFILNRLCLDFLVFLIPLNIKWFSLCITLDVFTWILLWFVIFMVIWLFCNY